jgi:hypothetical protein
MNDLYHHSFQAQTWCLSTGYPIISSPMGNLNTRFWSSRAKKQKPPGKHQLEHPYLPDLNHPPQPPTAAIYQESATIFHQQDPTWRSGQRRRSRNSIKSTNRNPFPSELLDQSPTTRVGRDQALHRAGPFPGGTSGAKEALVPTIGG